MSIKEFWYLTPYEFSLEVKAYNKRTKAEQDERMTLTYLGAVWQRTKKMPKLQEFLHNKPQKKRMTSEQMFDMVKSLHAAFGGE